MLMPAPLDYARFHNPDRPTGAHRPLYVLVAVPLVVDVVAFALALAYRVTADDAIIGAAAVVAVLGTPLVGLLSILGFIDVITACLNPIDRVKGIVHTLLILLILLATFPIAVVAYILAVA